MPGGGPRDELLASTDRSIRHVVPESSASILASAELTTACLNGSKQRHNGADILQGQIGMSRSLGFREDGQDVSGKVVFHCSVWHEVDAEADHLAEGTCP